MGLKSEMDATFNALVESGNIRYTVEPNLAAGIAAVSDGVVGAWAISPYVQIVAAAVVPNPCWFCGIIISTPVVEAFESDIVIAIGAGAAEVDIAAFYATSELFAVVEGKNTAYYLPFPIKVTGTPRFAVAIAKSTAASAAGWSLKIAIAAAVGS